MVIGHTMKASITQCIFSVYSGILGVFDFCHPIYCDVQHRHGACTLYSSQRNGAVSRKRRCVRNRNYEQLVVRVHPHKIVH